MLCCPSYVWCDVPLTKALLLTASNSQAAAHVRYPTHVPLNILQKGAVAGLSALGALVR